MDNVNEFYDQLKSALNEPDNTKEIIDYTSLEDPFYLESIFSKSSMRFLDQYANGEEAYFGDTNELKMMLIHHIGRLREVYNRVADKKALVSDRKKYINDFYPIISDIEKLIVKSFNIEKCSLGLMDVLNAFAYPLCWDRKLVIREKINGRFKNNVNNSFKASLEDIIETKTGFKYKDPKGKCYVLCLGLGFFDENYTDAEIAGVLLHELGHCMQQAICSINENLASTVIASTIDYLYQILNPFFTIGSLGVNLLTAIVEGLNLNILKSMDKDDLGDQVILEGIGSDLNGFSRDNLASELKERTDDELKNAATKKSEGAISKILKTVFVSFFGGLMRTVTLALTPIMYIINIPRHILMASNNKFLQKNKRFEQFADMFAASYGLGPEQGSALAKMGNVYYKVDLGAFNWINYVPVLNVAISMGNYINVYNMCLISGYPDMKKRIVGLYKTLKYELENNNDLTKQEKDEINKQIDELNRVYNEYVFDFGPKGFVYAVWSKLTRKSLENESSDIEENVLEALRENQEKMKLIEAKNGSKPEEIKNITKQSIKAAVIKTMKSMKEKNMMTGFINKFSGVINSL